MAKNYKLILLEILFFYFLAVFQMSFLPHFNFFLKWQISLNLILFFVVLINFLNRADSFWGFEAGFLGGFFLDIFSKSPLPLSILLFLILIFFIKKILRDFRTTIKKNLILFFFFVLLFSTTFYNFFLKFVLNL